MAVFLAMAVVHIIAPTLQVNCVCKILECKLSGNVIMSLTQGSLGTPGTPGI